MSIDTGADHITAATQTPDRPNIVLIVADDLGFSDIGCFGSEIETPNLDRLADDGVRLTQLYNDARCCPSRASLMTGCHPHEVGMGHMVTDLGHPSYVGALREDSATIAETLRDAGYRTYMAGKWHLGGGALGTAPSEWRRLAGTPGTPRPVDRGFDHHFGTLSGACSYFDPHTLLSDTAFVRATDPDFYYTDAIGEEAAGAIRRYAAADDPFFVYAAYTAPHWPLHARSADVERFRGRYLAGWDATRTDRHERAIELGVISPDWPISPRDSHVPPWDEIQHQQWEDARMAVYAAMVHRMDHSIGRILDAIRDSGVEDKTLVVFLSDNGGCAEFLHEDLVAQVDLVVPETRDGRPVRIGDHPELDPGADNTYMAYGVAWANVSNTPFRRFKSEVHEGGISGPSIVSLPGVLPSDEIVHAPCHLVDLTATLLDVAGTVPPEERDGIALTRPSGESLLSLLRGGTWRRSAPIAWEHEGNRAIRWNDDKLVAQRGRPWELYDLGADRTELDDLADVRPERVDELAGSWRSWADRVGVVRWEELTGS